MRKKMILEPHKMHRSGFLEEDLIKDSNISIPYEHVPDGKGSSNLQPTEFPFSPINFSAGGLVSSANEMANYIIMTMNGGEFAGLQLFEPSLLEQLQQFHHVNPVQGNYGKNGYGFGWNRLDDFFGHTLISHGGGITGGY